MEGYEQKALDFLKYTGTTMKAEFLGRRKFFPDDTEERDVYKITLKRGGREFSFDFGQSVHRSGKWTIYAGGKKVTNDPAEAKKYRKGERIENKDFAEPTAYDVLSCLQKYDVGIFSEFCSEFGYDEDSMKAEKIYEAVCKEWDMVQKLWTDDEIEELRKIE